MLSENATITLLESGADTVRPWRYIYPMEDNLK